MIRAFFFDLDGTLLDTEILWCRAVRAYLAERGVELSPDAATALVYGHSWHDIYTQVAARTPALAIGEARMAGELRPHFLRLRASIDVRIASSVALLRRLAAVAPVAVVSGSPRAEIAGGLSLMGVESAVRFFIGSEDYPAGKPDPTCFLMAAARLNLEPAACLVFEDSAAGVRAAKAAGMPCVALARPGAPRQDVSSADLVLDDLAKFDLDSFVRRAASAAP